ncbi:Serine protease AprX [Caloramator mitchellensis]|uniref:Serine protease AprX n=1 Tax=Caloramator mitchellensis TaxID=908809 RepID=A0A0R3JYT0_CALMK|nr:S8 family serine peptidase [Caloramator mitchellensis]KRQ86308.1 Serine protease AprX [Caloramator mitchellensis]
MFFINRKIDAHLKQFMKLNIKNKIPVIILIKSNTNKIKSKVLSSNGKIKWEYENISAISCELSPMSIDALTEYPEVSFICYDYKGNLCLTNAHKIMGTNIINVYGLTGKNIGIGLIDTGVYPHPDLINKRNTIAYFKDLINGFDKPYDDNGHGTFLSGCIAANKYTTNIEGIAPDSSIYMIKAFDTTGKGFLSDVVKGIDILISMSSNTNLRIITLPFEFDISPIINPLELIIKTAISKNIIVVAAAGNNGPQSFSINCPGNIEEVITVGGAECSGNIKSCKVASYSGRGPTTNKITKPDVVMLSSNITSLSSDTTYLPGKSSHIASFYTIKSGTSIAAAFVAAYCAIMLEKTPTLTPKDMKSVVCLSTISLGENKYSQGKGLVTFT